MAKCLSGASAACMALRTLSPCWQLSAGRPPCARFHRLTGTHGRQARSLAQFGITANGHLGSKAPGRQVEAISASAGLDRGSASGVHAISV